MSKLEVNAVEPQCGTNLTLGASGDTIIIPSGATISNQGTAAGFGPTGAVSWNTTKITANPNPAVTGVGYFCDTTSAAFTVTLPATPAAGAVVGIADYANTFATNNLTVGRNGSNIGGLAANGILSTNGLSVTFVYVDATQGWIVTDSGNRSDLPTPEYVAATGGCIATCGNYKIHTFTGPGTFTVTNDGNPLGSTTVDYLVVAGGGGASGRHAAGAGAGGFRTNYPSGCAGIPVSVQGYPVVIGAGGSGAPDPGGYPVASTSTSGNNSSVLSITSAGGGRGVTYDTAPTNNAGGSGGGGGYISGPGGSGNTPPVSPPQGNPGGAGAAGSPEFGGGGGGGASTAGTTGTPSGGGPGGNGSANSITGSSVTYAGGGAGAGSSVYGTGGTGGGGPAGNTGTPGTINTGGGGGAGGGFTPAPSVGGNGGSGIVLIRYKFQ